MTAPAPSTPLIDALPYIDRQYEAHADEVDALIAAEMQAMGAGARRSIDDRFPPADQLLLAGAVKTPSMRHAELTRVANAQPSAQLDLTRYRMDEPAADAPLPEWLAAVDNARAQLEHQRLRHLNLQLLAKFGVPSWQAHTAELESMLRKVEEETAELRARVVEVNRQRKMEQKAAGGKLRELEDRWVELVNQSLQVELACTQLERQLGSE